MMLVVGSGVALTAVFLSLYLRAQQKEIAVLTVVSASVILFSFAVTDAGKAVAAIRQAVLDSGVGLEVETLLKALGIAALTQITADICRDVGEGTIAGQVELMGKMEIVLLALPLASQLLTLAKGLLS